MGLSNMLSKLFKKEMEDGRVMEDDPIKFKDFDSIISPPPPKTFGILIYKTMNLGMKDFSFKKGDNNFLDSEKTEIENSDNQTTTGESKEEVI